MSPCAFARDAGANVANPQKSRPAAAGPKRRAQCGLESSSCAGCLDEEAKSGAFAYVVGGFSCHSLVPSAGSSIRMPLERKLDSSCQNKISDLCRSGFCHATFSQCAECNMGNLDGDAIFVTVKKKNSRTQEAETIGRSRRGIGA